LNFQTELIADVSSNFVQDPKILNNSFKLDFFMKVVIIGGGAAGMTAASRIKAIKPDGK
jgi:NADPH:sulfur oxidoreductase